MIIRKENHAQESLHALMLFWIKRQEVLTLAVFKLPSYLDMTILHVLRAILQSWGTEMKEGALPLIWQFYKSLRGYLL